MGAGLQTGHVAALLSYGDNTLLSDWQKEAPLRALHWALVPRSGAGTFAWDGAMCVGLPVVPLPQPEGHCQSPWL